MNEDNLRDKRNVLLYQTLLGTSSLYINTMEEIKEETDTVKIVELTARLILIQDVYLEVCNLKKDRNE